LLSCSKRPSFGRIHAPILLLHPSFIPSLKRKAILGYVLEFWTRLEARMWLLLGSLPGHALCRIQGWLTLALPQEKCEKCHG
jgi:hypothetical protein